MARQRQKNRRRKLSKKQRHVIDIKQKTAQSKLAGWSLLEPTALRPLSAHRDTTFKPIEYEDEFTPKHAFQLIWTPDFHQQWLSRVSPFVRGAHPLLSDENLLTTGWHYLGAHFKFTVEPLESIRKHWPDVTLMARDAFEVLHGKRGAWDNYSMSSALSDNMMAQVNLGSDLAIDEIIFETSISDLACSVIPRKPHSKGIVAWGIGAKISRFPYVIRVFSKTKEYLYWKTEDIVAELVSKLKPSTGTNFVFDSWFDSTAVKQYLTSNKFYYTASAHTGHDDPHFWQQAKFNIKPTEWRQYYNSKLKEVRSVFCDEGIHCCVSTAYHPVHNLNQHLERAPLSTQYKKYFNAIDLFDRTFYQLPFPHKRMKVQDVIFDNLLHVALVDSMAIYNYYNQDSQVTLREYINLLYPQLMAI